MENERLTLAQLASNYNQMVVEAQALGSTQHRPVSRFKSKEDGERRIAAMLSSLAALRQSAKAADKEGPVPAPASQEEGPAAVPAPVSAVEEVSEDMAKRKKGKATKATKPRVRAANGATIEAKTQAFNDLVPKAVKLGYKYKVHTSAFGSHEHADKMTKKINKDISNGRVAD